MLDIAVQNQSTNEVAKTNSKNSSKDEDGSFSDLISSESEKLSEETTSNLGINSVSLEIKDKSFEFSNQNLNSKNSLKLSLKSNEIEGEIKSSKNLDTLLESANRNGLNIKKFSITKENLNSEKVSVSGLSVLKNDNLVSFDKLKMKSKQINNLIKNENEKSISLESLLQGEKSEKAVSLESLLANKDSNKEKKSSINLNKDAVVGAKSAIEELMKSKKVPVIEGDKKEFTFKDKFSIEDKVEAKPELKPDLELGLSKKDVDFEFKNRSINAKDTLKTFVSDLEEKIKDYKPPFVKIELSLRPKDLGNLDVTLLSRGNSLHINLASNQQAVNMMMQNMGEFKEALAEIGFENVNIDFNFSGGESGSEGQEAEQKKQSILKYLSGDSTEDFNLDEVESLNIEIPNYA